jgi:hypothetical protein
MARGRAGAPVNAQGSWCAVTQVAPLRCRLDLNRVPQPRGPQTFLDGQANQEGAGDTNRLGDLLGLFWAHALAPFAANASLAMGVLSAKHDSLLAGHGCDF